MQAHVPHVEYKSPIVQCPHRGSDNDIPISFVSGIRCFDACCTSSKSVGCIKIVTHKLTNSTNLRFAA